MIQIFLLKQMNLLRLDSTLSRHYRPTTIHLGEKTLNVHTSALLILYRWIRSLQST